MIGAQIVERILSLSLRQRRGGRRTRGALRLTPPVDHVKQRTRGDRNQHGVVVPRVPHVVGLDGARESPGERRQDEREPGRARTDEAGPREKNEERRKLDRRGRQDIPERGDLARGGRTAHRRARPGRGPVEGVGPRARGIHGGQQHLHRHHKRDDTEQRVSQATQDRGPPLAAPTPCDRQTSHEDREPQVLLDEDQRSQPRHARAPPPLHEGDAPERQQRNRHADLVKLRADCALQPPAQPVDQPDEERTAPTEQALREARDRHDRRGDQHVLDDEKRERRGEEPIHRPQQRQDRMEMIAQQVVARPLDGDDGRLEARVGLDGLGEDPQVPGGHDERAPLGHGIADVERADGARNDGGQPPGRDDAPDG